jgi:hypothetical protein
LVAVFIPALAPLLLRAERAKGSPLTEPEVIAIRDAANCVMIPRGATQAIRDERGYEDIDPEDCWVEWQRMRVELADPTQE